jgi:biotin carboxyl carrier protein
LVPVDAPDPLQDEQAFYRSAVPIGRIDSLARNMATKHVFVALEACQAGSLFGSSLGEVVKSNPQGYLFSRKLQEPSRQFLTAGDAHQDVPATNLFTGVLEEGFDKADLNGDGYVTGSELMQYVTLNLPQRLPTNSLTPEQGATGDGDMIIGPVRGKAPKSVPLGPEEAGEHRVQLNSMVSGTITKILVGRGADVVTGQPLFQLESREAQSKLRLAKAKSDEANANLVSAQKGQSQIQQDVSKGIKARDAADESAAKIRLLVSLADAASTAAQEAQYALDATTRTAPMCGRVVDLVKARGDTVESGATVLTMDTAPCVPKVGTTSAASFPLAPAVAASLPPAARKPRSPHDPSIPDTTLFSSFPAAGLKDRVKARCLAAQSIEENYNADVARLTADGPGPDFTAAKAKMDSLRTSEQNLFQANYLPELRDLHYELLNRLDLNLPDFPRDISRNALDAYSFGFLRGQRPIGEFCDYLTALAARLPR